MKAIEGGFVNIDKEKFETELTKRGLLKTVLSKEMGFNHTYIGKQVNNGKMRLNTVNYLKGVYNIDPDLYTVKEETPPETIEPKECIVPIDYDKLYETIYNAVYMAVKKAWENE